MEPPNKPSYLKLIVIVLILMLLTLGVYHLYKSVRFYVVSTSPAAGKMTTQDSALAVTFNKPLSANGISLSSNPQSALYNNRYTVQGDTLIMQLNVPLNSNQTYTFTIQRIADTSGQTLRNLHFTYQPKSVDRSQTSSDSHENLIQRNVQSSVYKDPILNYLPYSTLDFSLTSSFPVDSNNIPKLVLQAQILVPPGLSTAQQTTTIAQYKQEVLQYIQSVGLNPANYTIQYQIVYESLDNGQIQ